MTSERKTSVKLKCTLNLNVLLTQVCYPIVVKIMQNTI